MAAADIPSVAAIERLTFPPGWPATVFARELTENRVARYIVLERSATGEIVGFGGLWLLLDEAHVVTVAVSPAARGRGYGGLIVLGLVQAARREGMFAATLECRVSNEAARGLYRDYGFYEVGLRKRYYADTGEDAVIMTTEPLESDRYQQRLARLQARLEALMPGAGASPGASRR